MVFDHRMVAPVRMAALGIWRAMQGAEMRVAPTLQQMRPLRGGPATTPAAQPFTTLALV
jgi:hypothetical protein